MIILKAADLHKTYYTKDANVPVLKGINLDVEEGEMLVVLGASGAGKSTLLHLLGGLDAPTQGEVLLSGVNLYKIRDELRALIRNKDAGFIFQFYHLLPEFTALENVMLPALIAGENLPAVRGRAMELIAEVELENRSSHYPSQLSGGEQQRVAIARALINNPKVLFCDEPTGNLDSKTGDKICGLLVKLNQRNKQTIIIATHSKDIAEISDRIVFVKDGQLTGEA